MEAIVLAIQKYKDNASILHTYTRPFGRVQFIIYGKKNLSVLTPMAQVNIEAEIVPTRTIHTLKEVSLNYIPLHLREDIRRQCVVLFMAEALYKTLQHPMSDETLFDWICEKIKLLDLADSIEDIPQKFLYELSELLGYGGEPIDELKDLKSAELLN